MAQVTVIIPAYGQQALTERAVKRLRKQTLYPDEIIVVDDGSAEPLSALAGVRLLRHGTNRGFAAAINTGVKAAQTPLVAILNNDVKLAADWLERLVPVISERSADFACGKLYRPDGRIDGTFDLISRGGLAWRAGAGRDDGSLWSKPQTVSFTSFTAVVAKTDAIELDESYHSYYEDVAWSLGSAISNKIGYFEPAATGIHAGSVTSGAWSHYSASQLLRNHRRFAHQYLLPAYRREYLISRLLLKAHAANHLQWPAVPRESVAAKERSPRLAEVLRNSEALLYELQRETGMDRLWRWYFRLAGRMA